MICTSKERETCNQEKLGCKGCFYNSLTNEEVEECIKELKKVRPEILNDKGVRLFKAIMQIIEERDELKVQIDYYKARYLEFNEGMIAGMKAIKKRDFQAEDIAQHIPNLL